MKRRKNPKNGYKAEMKLIGPLDELAIWDEIKSTMLPMLRKDLADGLTSEQILKKYEAFAAARLVHNVIADPDSGKSNAASKEILDRIQGKPTEKKELTHKLGRLSDQELDALLISKATTLESSSDEE